MAANKPHHQRKVSPYLGAPCKNSLTLATYLNDKQDSGHDSGQAQVDAWAYAPSWLVNAVLRIKKQLTDQHALYPLRSAFDALHPSKDLPHDFSISEITHTGVDGVSRRQTSAVAYGDLFQMDELVRTPPT